MLEAFGHVPWSAAREAIAVDGRRVTLTRRTNIVDAGRHLLGGLLSWSVREHRARDRISACRGRGHESDPPAASSRCCGPWGPTIDDGQSPRVAGGEPVADRAGEGRAPRKVSRSRPSVWCRSAIDEFPALLRGGGLCPRARRVLTGARELRVKESDRIAAMADGTGRPSACDARAAGRRHAHPRRERPNGGRVDSLGDHRIAMAFAVAGPAGPRRPVVVENCAQRSRYLVSRTFAELARGAGLDVRLRRRTADEGRRCERAGDCHRRPRAASARAPSARRLAALGLGFHLLDSGALYRLVALGAAERIRWPSDDVPALAALAVGPGRRAFRGRRPVRMLAQPLLGGQPVGESACAAKRCGDAASRIAAYPEVRSGAPRPAAGLPPVPPGLVADGRDMGSVVFHRCPGLKIYLTASVEERARRRL